MARGGSWSAGISLGRSRARANPHTRVLCVGEVRWSLARADIVKLNEDELQQVGGWFGLPRGLREGAAALAESFGCGTVCVTRGRRGRRSCTGDAGRSTRDTGWR
jgi:sugar/nucleoside kinase (ribokinase family)